ESCTMYMVCFFFQAEDGIRDDLVTGVQTCALPISAYTETKVRGVEKPSPGLSVTFSGMTMEAFTRESLPTFTGNETVSGMISMRSEERRVGKECRCH